MEWNEGMNAALVDAACRHQVFKSHQSEEAGCWHRIAHSVRHLFPEANVADHSVLKKRLAALLTTRLHVLGSRSPLDLTEDTEFDLRLDMLLRHRSRSHASDDPDV